MIVREEIKHIVARSVDVDPQELSEDIDFRKDYNYDIIDIGEIVIAVEEHFGIEGMDEFVIETFGDLLRETESALSKSGKGNLIGGGP